MGVLWGVGGCGCVVACGCVVELGVGVLWVGRGFVVGCGCVEGCGCILNGVWVCCGVCKIVGVLWGVEGCGL